MNRNPQKSDLERQRAEIRELREVQAAERHQIGLLIEQIEEMETKREELEAGIRTRSRVLRSVIDNFNDELKWLNFNSLPLAVFKDQPNIVYRVTKRDHDFVWAASSPFRRPNKFSTETGLSKTSDLVMDVPQTLTNM